MEELSWGSGPGVNSIAWLVWHLTRAQDDHVGEVAGHPQLWDSAGWRDRFGLPLGPDETGYGHSEEQVALVRASSELLAGYHAEVASATDRFLLTVDAGDLELVVDRNWGPPVSLGVRLVSVIGDDWQHVGQAAYVRGLLQRRR